MENQACDLGETFSCYYNYVCTVTSTGDTNTTTSTTQGRCLCGTDDQFGYAPDCRHPTW